MKRSAIADDLVDNAIKVYELLNFSFLDEDMLVVEKEVVDWWTLCFNEAINIYSNRAAQGRSSDNLS